MSLDADIAKSDNDFQHIVWPHVHEAAAQAIGVSRLMLRIGGRTADTWANDFDMRGGTDAQLIDERGRITTAAVRVQEYDRATFTIRSRTDYGNHNTELAKLRDHVERGTQFATYMIHAYLHPDSRRFLRAGMIRSADLARYLDNPDAYYQKIPRTLTQFLVIPWRVIDPDRLHMFLPLPNTQHCPRCYSRFLYQRGWPLCVNCERDVWRAHHGVSS